MRLDHLEAAAKVSLMQQSPGYAIGRWHLETAAFEDRLRGATFGSNASYVPLFAFLNVIARAQYFFLDEDGLRLLLGSYRGCCQPAAPWMDASPEARAHLDQRHASLATLSPDHVARTVRQGATLALLV